VAGGLSRFSRRLCVAKMGLSPSRVQAAVGLPWYVIFWDLPKRSRGGGQGHADGAARIPVGDISGSTRQSLSSDQPTTQPAKAQSIASMGLRFFNRRRRG